MVQDGFDPLETLESLEIKYHQYEQCHKIISTPDSISELKNWRNQRSSDRLVYLYELDTARLEVFVLPKHGTRFTTPAAGPSIKNQGLERAYRVAVVAQQMMAEHTAKWHKDTLPVGRL
jgi:hypothetical protein